MKVYEKLLKCVASVKEKIEFNPEIALVLGTGLGEYAEHIEIVKIIEYKSIEGFPISTVEGHKGRFLFGYVKGVPVVIMQGRIHYYEGYSINDVVLPIRLMGMLGAKVLFLTNASGGVNFSYKPGDFMLIKDQISNFVPSPLIGENITEMGKRFPDMSEIYNKNLRRIILSTAEELNIELKEGVYIQLTGPNFESPSEVNMCRILGADAVGMSTACEAIAGNHMGMKICGITCISNLCSGMSKSKLSAEEVYDTTNKVEKSFAMLITESISRIHEGSIH